MCVGFCEIGIQQADEPLAGAFGIMAVPVFRVLTPNGHRGNFLFFPLPAFLIRAYCVNLDFLSYGVLFVLPTTIPPFPLYRFHAAPSYMFLVRFCFYHPIQALHAALWQHLRRVRPQYKCRHV